jgi:hypothetical protein
MKTLLLLLLSFCSYAQIVRPAGKIPYAGMYIVVTKDHPFPKCEDLAKVNWKAMKAKHDSLKWIAKEYHDVTIVYPGNKRVYLTFDQFREIACK